MTELDVTTRRLQSVPVTSIAPAAKPARRQFWVSDTLNERSMCDCDLDEPMKLGMLWAGGYLFGTKNNVKITLMYEPNTITVPRRRLQVAGLPNLVLGTHVQRTVGVSRWAGAPEVWVNMWRKSPGWYGLSVVLREHKGCPVGLPLSYYKLVGLPEVDPSREDS